MSRLRVVLALTVLGTGCSEPDPDGPPTGTPDDDDATVVDADFEEVDDERKDKSA